MEALRWRRPLSAGALAVRAPWPAAGPALAFLQLLLGPANAAFSGHLLPGILDPADELVAGQRRDVLPGVECHRIGDQSLAQVSWKLVHHPTGHSRATHRNTVAIRGEPSHHQVAGPIRSVPTRTLGAGVACRAGAASTFGAPVHRSRASPPGSALSDRGPSEALPPARDVDDQVHDEHGRRGQVPPVEWRWNGEEQRTSPAPVEDP